MATEKEKLIARYENKKNEVPTLVAGKESVIAALENEATYGDNEFLQAQVEELNREINRLNGFVPEYQEVIDLLSA